MLTGWPSEAGPRLSRAMRARHQRSRVPERRVARVGLPQGGVGGAWAPGRGSGISRPDLVRLGSSASSPGKRHATRSSPRESRPAAHGPGGAMSVWGARRGSSTSELGERYTRCGRRIGRSPTRSVQQWVGGRGVGGLRGCCGRFDGRLHGSAAHVHRRATRDWGEGRRAERCTPPFEAGTYFGAGAPCMAWASFARLSAGTDGAPGRRRPQASAG